MAASAQSLAEQVGAMHMVVDRLRGLVEGEPNGDSNHAAFEPAQREAREDNDARARLQQALPLPASRGAKVQRVGGGGRGPSRRSAPKANAGRSRLAPQTTIH
jgi:hypothetical protein